VAKKVNPLDLLDIDMSHIKKITVFEFDKPDTPLNSGAHTQPELPEPEVKTKCVPDAFAEEEDGFWNTPEEVAIFVAMAEKRYPGCMLVPKVAAEIHMIVDVREDWGPKVLDYFVPMWTGVPSAQQHP